jgi:hypothetical protein
MQKKVSGIKSILRVIRLSCSLNLLLLLLSLFICACRKSGSPGNTVSGKFEVYPALPGGEYKSDRYLVSVTQNGESQDSYVFVTNNPLDGDGATQYMSMANHFTTFSFSGAVTVQVTLPVRTTALSTVEVRPLAKKVKAIIDGGIISVSLTNPGNYYLFIKGEEKNPLFIFANPLEINPPAPANNPNTVYLDPGTHTNVSETSSIYFFKPGIHDIGKTGGTFQNVPGGSVLYLAGGAFVRGRTQVVNGGTMIVRGRGVLSGINIPHKVGLWADFMIDVWHGGANVEGIIISDAPQDNIVALNKSLADNVKILSWHWFNEGICFFGVASTVSNSFFKTPEDNILLFTNNLVVTNNVFYQDGSSPLQLGWNASYNVSNIIVDGVDIVGSIPGTTWQGPGGYTTPNMPVIGLRNDNGALYKNIIISNVRCDVKPYMLIFIQLKATYPPGVTGTGGVDGITFRNIDVPIPPIIPSLLDGNGSNPGDIKNVTFENLKIGGLLITEQNASGYITRSGNTSNFIYK